MIPEKMAIHRRSPENAFDLIFNNLKDFSP